MNNLRRWKHGTQCCAKPLVMDFGLEGATAICQVLAYVVPQINNTPSTSGYSPAQWVLGRSPNFPGELLGTNLPAAHLDTPFEDELSKHAVAKMAIVQAEMDQKLRRALLRKYAGTNTVLYPGQPCFFWLKDWFKFGSSTAMAGMTPDRPVQKRRVISPLHEMDGDDTRDDELIGTPTSNSDRSGPLRHQILIAVDLLWMQLRRLCDKRYKLQLSHWKTS